MIGTVMIDAATMMPGTIITRANIKRNSVNFIGVPGGMIADIGVAPIVSMGTTMTADIAMTADITMIAATATMSPVVATIDPG